MNNKKKETPIFILCGKARAGKDTTAEIIKEYFNEHDKKTVVLAYATYIKEYAKKISGWDGNDETKPRMLLNTIGTDIVRKKIDDMFFVKRTIEDINVYQYFFDEIVISDARFPIEITSLKEKFDKVYAIKIERPNFENELSSEEKNHAVETSLNDFNDYNYIIENDSTIEELKHKVYKLMEELTNEC